MAKSKKKDVEEVNAHLEDKTFKFDKIFTTTSGL
jgi:hypothetical protein